jgi:hypothetical protein
MSQLPPTAPPQGPAAAAGLAVAAGKAAGGGLAGAVAGLSPVVAGLKVAPGAPACVGAAVVAGNCAGAAGFTGAAAPGLIAGACGEEVWGEAGDCASEVSANASEHRQVVINVFIVEAVEARIC